LRLRGGFVEKGRETIPKFSSQGNGSAIDRIIDGGGGKGFGKKDKFVDMSKGRTGSGNRESEVQDRKPQGVKARGVDCQKMLVKKKPALLGLQLFPLRQRKWF